MPFPGYQAWLFLWTRPIGVFFPEKRLTFKRSYVKYEENEEKRP